MSFGDQYNTTVLSVIIPTKEREEMLLKHLHQLIKVSENLNVEIIIVNDGELPLTTLPSSTKIKIHQNPKSGVASARNYGAKMANSNLLLFLDDDMIIYKENIDAIISFHQKYKHSFLNLNWTYPPKIMKKISKTPFGRYLQYYGFSTLKGWNKDNPNWQDESLFCTTGITSQNLSVPHDLFNGLGGYNENFPYAGFEDHEFSSRINKAGYKIYIDPTQMMHHDEQDRLKLHQWLQRKYRGGVTRRVAVAFGFKEFELKASSFKKAFIYLLRAIQDIWIKISPIICKRKFTDILYFKIVNLFLASAIYRGYFSKEANSILMRIPS
jgi:GT2 family glycosyltransferase